MIQKATGVGPAGDHGGDGLSVARQLDIPAEQIIDLSASLNPFAPDITDIAARALASLGRYPNAQRATDALAEAVGVDAERLVLTNGGAEAIALVAAYLVDGAVVEPAFSLYRRHLRTGDDSSCGTWKANPSSPLGRFADRDDRATVWDEAFWPMTTGTWTRGDGDAWRIGSLTKLWACPGLRLGYVIAPTAAAARSVVERQPKWSVNGLATEMLVPLLEQENLVATAARVGAHRAAFAEQLSDLGFSVLPGAAPWVLLAATPGLRSDLAPSGVVVRDCASFGLSGVHRLALPRLADLDRVLTVLATTARN